MMWKYQGTNRPAFADTPGPGQESVWDYPRPPRLIEDPRHIVVSSGSRLVADTHRSIRVCETASPPSFYLPIDDVDSHALIEVFGATMCEWKGRARYFALCDDASETVVAWDYPAPLRAFSALKNHIGFYPGRIECFVDGVRVSPQPGGFYAGWITAEIVGPVKGEPGTEHW